jgi:integration host factor subunit beta
MSQNKSDLITAVANRARIQTGHAEVLINRVFECMAAALARGEGVEIRSFASFTVREYGAYRRRKPRSGAAVQVKPTKRLPFFKVSKELRERVNASRDRSASTVSVVT